MSLRHAGRYRSHSHLGNELHRNPRLGVDVLQVIDELRQVLNRIDIVMRRRRNQAHSRNRIAHTSDDVVHLATRQLPAFSRLGALRDLDLQIIRVHQVIGRNAKTGRGHLLDRAPAQIAIRVRLEATLILSAFAGVGLPADAVHGNRQSLMRFLADRAEGHGARRKALHDFGGGLDFLERNGGRGRLEIEHAAEHLEIAVLLVHDVRKLTEGLEFRLPHGMLELADRRRIQEVALAAHTKLIFAANPEFRVGFMRRLHRKLMLHERFASQDLNANAFDSRGGARKVFLDERAVQADRLKDLRSLIALQGGDPHLGEGLQKTLVDRFHVTLENHCPTCTQPGTRRPCEGPRGFRSQDTG